MRTINAVLKDHGMKTTKTQWRAALRSLAWTPCKATLRGLLLEDGTLYPCNPTDDLPLTTLMYSWGGYSFRPTKPADLMLYDLEVALLHGEPVLLRYQSDHYKKRGGWCLQDCDDPKELDYHVAHGLPHRYARRGVC